MFKVQYEIGPNYTTEQVNHDLVFLPLMVGVFKNSLLGIDRLRKSIFRIDLRDSSLAFYKTNISLVDPISCFYLYDRVVCVDRSARKIYIGSTLESLRLIKELKVEGKFVSAESLGNNIALLTSHPSAINIIDKRGKLIRKIDLDDRIIRHPKG